MRQQIMFLVRASIGTLVVAYVCVACGSHDEMRGEVIRSVDGASAKAVITGEDVGGATGTRIYRVYVQDSRNRAEILRAVKIQDLQVAWNPDGNLLIRIPCGQIVEFRNFYYRVNSDGESAVQIGVLLDSGGPCASRRPPAFP